MEDPIYAYASSDFNLQALLSLAGKIRGQPCKCDTSQFPQTGFYNWVIFLCFDDGVEWVLRCPYNHRPGIYSVATSAKVIASEVAALRYLKAFTSIPVPEVYSHSATSDNDIGLPYILQSKATGHAIGSNWYPSSPTPAMPHLDNSRRIPEENRKKVLTQLGVIMSELSEHRFDKIGSLFQDEEGNYVVGECLAPPFIVEERDSLDIERGPFKQECDYLTSLVEAVKLHAQKLPLEPYLFFAPSLRHTDYDSVESYWEASSRCSEFVAVGQKAAQSKNMLHYIIAGQLLHEMIPQLSSDVEGSFVLSHPDMYSGNIFVDDEFNITCIIGWGATSTGPITQLLAPMSLAWLGGTLSEARTEAYWSGLTQRQLAPELQCPKLRDTSKRICYFTILVRCPSPHDYSYFKQLFELVYNTNAEEAADGKGIVGLFHERANLPENKQLFAKLLENDISAEEVAEGERLFFSCKRAVMRADGMAVARKLTLMSEMNPCFIADKRLWRWVVKARKDFST
ncbi:hypothetical protein B0I35DRAFT_441487 [Stachybotrys elegans]|uniref:Aminoglycoside phosphotransferase domain-containing protein n=1 Tax=Stachybotrys elegans TaxID=80388 RepID=A0A8K0SJA8_9HYPO|nr:hypothetical protein B0I35DRAFT_441487 [Stachybotrys elegans]